MSRSHCRIAFHLLLFALATEFSVVGQAAESDQKTNDRPSRVTTGLQVFYNFAEASGEVVKDRSGVGEPVHLKITDGNSVRRSAGSLQIVRRTTIRSERPARKLIDSVRQSGAITIEAWIEPANATQSGPARMVTLSKNANERNFTLGQDGDRFDVRLRTTSTSTNGIPAVATPGKSAQPRLTHVGYTHSRDGQTRIFVDGRSVVQKSVPGLPSNWNADFEFALGNELSGDRPWLGTFHLVAVYNRDLTRDEIGQNFRAGPQGDSTPDMLTQSNPGKSLFETQIAPLLANRCLECHDSASRQGLLDLSKKAAALTGGENGPSIVPGNADESLLWQMIEADDMPRKREPLSAAEKSLVKKWISLGATWTLDTIDPAVYAHQGQASGIVLQRLTVQEYINTVQAAVSVDISKEARELLPRDIRADGFSNTAYNLNVDLKHVDAFAKLAEIIVDRMDVEQFVRRFSKNNKLTDKSMGDVIEKVGRWLLRGPLDEREVIAYRGISTTVASTGGSFREAVSFIIEAMLQSPRFIYRIENQYRGSGNWPVPQQELATRMSYLIWGAPPDETLNRLVDTNSLHGDELNRQISRMLDDPRTIDRSLHFAAEWLNLGRLQNLSPNPERFPDWNAKLAEDMKAETLEYFRHVVWDLNRPMSALLNTQATFATPELARHYALPVAARLVQPDQKDRQISHFDLSKVKARGGLLTHGSVLTIGGDEASMVSRGLFVLHDLLRGVVRDPPPCVDTTPVPSKPGLTQRAIAEARVANKNCGGCHVRFEPLAYGLEKFDGIGALHENDEHGNRLREDGQILIPGDTKPIPYETVEELMNLLASSDRISETITWKLTQFALGRPLGARDAATVAKIHKAAQQSGGRYRDVITEIVLSDLVRTSPAVPSQPETPQ